jgi:hypothetical protein
MFHNPHLLKQRRPPISIAYFQQIAASQSANLLRHSRERWVSALNEVSICDNKAYTP